MIRNRRQVWLYSGLLIGVFILLILLLAPTRNQLMSGSTFSRSPDGYAAWYELMKESKTPIERWQKPFEALEGNPSENHENSITLLRIYGKSSQVSVNKTEIEWVKKGNTLVILASQGKVTEAPFSTSHKTQFGEVKIETTRRIMEDNQAILKDEFGAIIWEEKQSKGQIIYATTPYLAANAYKNLPGNYQFLAHLVESTPGNKILVDEYIHGYKDKNITETREDSNVFVYLVNTPLLIILIQGLLIVLIVIFADNNPREKRKSLAKKIVNNSEEYINALATILQNSQRRDFVLKTIGQAEQLQLQKQLGLKVDKQEIENLVQAWSQQTKKSPMMLESILKLSTKKTSLNDRRLLKWMKQWQTIHQEINPQPSDHDNRQ